MIKARREKFGAVVFQTRTGAEAAIDGELYSAFENKLSGNAPRPAPPELSELLFRLDCRPGETFEISDIAGGGFSYPFEVLSAPTLADIKITNACPLACPHCYAESGRGGVHMGWGVFLRALENCREAGVFEIALGGGEPLEHPLLFPMLHKIKRAGISASLATSGAHLTLIQSALLKNYCGAVALSIEHLDKRFEQRRGFSFERFRKSAENLKKTGNNLVFQITASKNNLSELADLVSFLERYEPYGIVFLAYKPAGRGKDYDGPASDSSMNAGVLIKEVISSHPRLRFGYDCCLAPLLSSGADQGYEGCSATRSSIAIDINLDVLPCSFSKTVIGNLHDDGLVEIWNNVKTDEFRNKLITDMDGPLCSACPHAKNCLGGCPEFGLHSCVGLA